jgi:rRNA maturation RNase YbeY
MSRSKVLISHPVNWGLDEAMIIRLASQVLDERGLREDVELSLLFVGRKRAKDLNMSFRKKEYIPQVLGFPMSKEKDKDGWIRLGDIVICTQKLKYEAKYLNKNIEMVALEWLRHGLDNLLK